MVKVFITVDAEIWPDAAGWPHTPLAPDDDCRHEVSRYLFGGEGASARGVPYQLAVLATYGLKATFFVDSMFSLALGATPLRRLLEVIRQHGQEVGLHLHPEWLTDPRCHALAKFAGPLLHRYSEADQSTLVRAGLDRLRECGSGPVRVFRAGSWAASKATLRALRRNGIVFDASLNGCFERSFPDLDGSVRSTYTQPVRLEDIWELPVTKFIDRPPGGYRPLHVCATSFAEFRTVLEHASLRDWFAVVIVLHSFEFVRVGQRAGDRSVSPQRLLASRFEQLCRYLAENSELYETCHFADLDESALARADQPAIPVSSYARTAMRHIQQLASRLY